MDITQQAKYIATHYQQQLLKWYAKEGRISLPWRNLKGENTPYGVYVSEIMLQQTQVKRVQEKYFIPFLHTFPTLKALAQAPLDSILKCWEGLGYYTRARNMQKSAIICCDKYNATLPRTRKELLQLPGIGAYTSGAILCFGFGESVSFVDGNIKRVLCRIFALREPSQALLDKLALLLLDSKHSFDYNQALLDLGAMICTPKSPSCHICPAHNFCNGKTNPALYPTPKSSHLTTLILHLAVYMNKKGEIAFVYTDEKEGKNSLYQGLYNLPSFKLEEIAHYEKCYTKCGSFKHHYTKYAITANVYWLDYEHLDTLRHMQSKKLHFFLPQELDAKPLSSLCKKALKLVDSRF